MTRLRFGIRDILWAMVVVSLAVGWWVERRQAERRYQKYRELWGVAIDRVVDDRTEVRLYSKYADLYWEQPENAAEYRRLMSGPAD